MPPEFQYELSLTTASELQQANTEAVEVFNTFKQKFTPIAQSKRNQRQTGRRRKTYKRKGDSPRISPSKVKRKKLYNIVQDRWKSKRRAKVVEAILTGNLRKVQQSPHGAPELDAFWRGVFEKES